MATKALVNAPADDLARHTRFRGVDQRLPSKRIDLDAELILHELARFAAREAVASNDRGRVELLFHKLVRRRQPRRPSIAPVL